MIQVVTGFSGRVKPSLVIARVLLDKLKAQPDFVIFEFETVQVIEMR